MNNTEDKFIYCLEGNWDKHPKSKQSIKPILELLLTFSKVKYIYKKCATKEDFTKGLKLFVQKRYSNYTVLYIAYHGRKNRIYFGREYITLKEIAKILDGKLKNKIVHFGSCSTLNTTEKNISDFIRCTKCNFISGYKKDVEYIASTAFELIYFEVLQYCNNLNKVKKIITQKYSPLVKNLRFTICI